MFIFVEDTSEHKVLVVTPRSEIKPLDPHPFEQPCQANSDDILSQKLIMCEKECYPIGKIIKSVFFLPKDDPFNTIEDLAAACSEWIEESLDVGGGLYGSGQ